MRAVFEEKDLIPMFNTARQEALGAFNNGDVYIEKLIQEPRHVEVQILGDGKGKVIHLGERDCSIQRRHQKLVEESPSPAVDEKLREKMGEAACKAAAAINYEGAGTIEFLLDKNGDFYFMEMNTRIQVEHTVTEEVTDIDLIQMQLLVAAGDKFDFPEVHLRGHSIECRINAEDPYNDFRPSPGKINAFHTPKGRGVRVDTHASAGYVIPPYYDSMIAKLICTAANRELAIAKMRRALNEFIIEGVKTTVPFHKQLMQDERFLSGKFDTSFLNNFTLK